ncbi:MAG: OmpA family protein [Chitinophagaceae bacterium]|nr:OmpA family protein [Chitinophagaceae bacterium]
MRFIKGRKFSQDFDTTFSQTVSIKAEEFVNYIDMPLNLVYKIKLGKKAKFILGGGPYGTVFFNGRLKTETITKNPNPNGAPLLYTVDENKDPAVGDGPNKYKVLGFGVNGLTGFEFGRVFITGNYSIGLDNFFKPAAYDASSYKHQVIGGTIGIFIGNPVEKLNKPGDKDKDGITDDKDNCPTEPGTAITNGCPDKDSDGIADKDDKCPGISGTVKYNGCPVPDSDSDGVNDDEDKCPSLSGIVKYNGCPVPDSDGDGINDEQDNCPAKPGTAKYNGCPIPDSDNDGINDEEDKCPAVSGVASNDGCPAVNREIIEQVNFAVKRIQFNQAKAILLPQSLPVLTEVAQILIENADLKLFIEGHTSNQGNYNFNMKLSEERAQAVRSYLISKGIGEERLSFEGFGPNKPIADEKTPAGKAQNRRVELRLNY